MLDHLVNLIAVLVEKHQYSLCKFHVNILSIYNDVVDIIYNDKNHQHVINNIDYHCSKNYQRTKNNFIVHAMPPSITSPIITHTTVTITHIVRIMIVSPAMYSSRLIMLPFHERSKYIFSKFMLIFATCSTDAPEHPSRSRLPLREVMSKY